MAERRSWSDVPLSYVLQRWTSAASTGGQHEGRQIYSFPGTFKAHKRLEPNKERRRDFRRQVASVSWQLDGCMTTGKNGWTTATSALHRPVASRLPSSTVHRRYPRQ
jgi:hypothetical protein